MKETIKIAFDYQIFQEQRFGGVSRYFYELYREMSSYDNCRVYIPILFSRNAYLNQIDVCRELKDFKFYRNNFVNMLFSFMNRMYVTDTIKKQKIDIVHPTWNHGYLNKRYKDRLVVTIHDMIHEIYWRDTAWKGIERKRKMIYDAKAIIAVSENTKKDILKLYPDVPEDKIRVIYHGTNHLPKPVSPVRFHIPDQYILFVGKRSDYKNAKIVYEAMSDLAAAYPKLYLFLVGGGKISDQEWEMLDRLQLRHRVRQENVTDAELAYLYSHAVCFVYPSKYEGFGFPLLEAFDNDCPVVSSNASCLPEIGAHGALYFNPDDEVELKEKIEQILTDEELRKDCVIRGRQRVKAFSWEKSARETFELYRKVMDGIKVSKS